MQQETKNLKRKRDCDEDLSESLFEDEVRRIKKPVLKKYDELFLQKFNEINLDDKVLVQPCLDDKVLVQLFPELEHIIEEESSHGDLVSKFWF